MEAETSTEQEAGSLKGEEQQQQEQEEAVAAAVDSAMANTDNDVADSDHDDSDDDDDDLSIESFIPSYLQHLVYPYYGDFCHTPVFHPRLVAQVMSEGFLPIAMSNRVLLPKMHKKRSIIQLPEHLHVSKSVRKKANRFLVSINTCFQKVIRGCHKQHKSHCWLYPNLVEAFRTIYNTQQEGMDVIVVDENSSNDDDNDDDNRRYSKVRMYSIEIWNALTGKLVAGEIGYTVGSIYTSLTGFSTQDSAGSVQLAALGRLLCQAGFTLWDLGMDMEYKRRLGAHFMSRTAYVAEVRRVREPHRDLILPTMTERVCARAVIDRSSSLPQSQQSLPDATTTAAAAAASLSNGASSSATSPKESSTTHASTSPRHSRETTSGDKTRKKVRV